MHLRAITQLRQTLIRTGVDYLVDRRDDQEWRIRFIGPFQGQDVIWQARIQTLRAHARSLPQNTESLDGCIKLRQFIHITPRPPGYALHIGLNLNKLDEAAILRTIIMIRQYKRLHIGHHEYGERVEFQLP